ncbi:helix-turn-helix domain-containing protein [Flavobacterium inviolabile]|uniref:helix-turn-helix domain-containing protein n=1 Tax=Flavobacterium inviolabile TaxID=2748320 RepID=UPI0015AC3B08|nr:AraC family transcriptional regulator [Flavobacterium inviolabile]
MHITVEYGNEVFRKKYSPTISRDNKTDYYSHPLALDKSKCEGEFKDFFFKNIYVSYANFRFNDVSRVHFENDTDTIKMHFLLYGQSQVKEAEGSLHRFETLQHNLIYCNKEKSKWNWYTPDHFKLFEVHIHPDFFKKYVCEEEPHIKQFLTSIKQKHNCTLAKKNLTITPEIIAIIENITGCKRKGIYKRLYIESQIVQLLLSQLEQMSCKNCPLQCSLKEADVNKMYQVRDLLLADMHYPFTLSELAYKVGTNEFTLKKGFKILFGTTVFGYLNDLKMEKAQKMLAEKNTTVTQVAEFIGYKNATHFTTAFKKKYGVVPSALKQ